jgi:ABC-type amino acid transport substrate-binding protein
MLIRNINNWLLRLVSAFSFVITAMLIQVQAEELTLLSGEYDPYTSEKLPGGGPYSVYLKEVFERAGFTLKIEFLPWARAEYLLDNGQVLGAFPYGITETRRAKYLFSQAIGKANLGAIMRKSHALNSESKHLSLNQLKKHRVLLLRGMYLEDEFFLREINFQSLNTLSQAINMLMLYRGDVFFEDILALKKGVDELSKEDQQEVAVFKIESIEDIVISQPFAIMYSAKYPGLEAYVGRINQAITELGIKKLD